MAIRISRSLLAVRVCLILFGGAAVAWGARTLPSSRTQSALHDMAQRIIAGEPYSLDTLVAQMPRVEMAERARMCDAEALHSAAVIRLRLTEEAMVAGRRDMIDDQLAHLHDTIRSALSCSPADPFLWLALFWVDNTRSGFSADRLALLRMSYRLGPNEGWIAVKRCHVALAIFDALPSDLAASAVKEFTRIVDAELYGAAAEILTGPGWRVRNALLSRLADIPQERRERFATALRGRGYELAIPGVADRARAH